MARARNQLSRQRAAHQTAIPAQPRKIPQEPERFLPLSSACPSLFRCNVAINSATYGLMILLTRLSVVQSREGSWSHRTHPLMGTRNSPRLLLEQADRCRAPQRWTAAARRSATAPSAVSLLAPCLGHVSSLLRHTSPML